jgi:putative DNA primase/helicase
MNAPAYDSAAVARERIAEGWATVPVRGKIPIPTGWQKLRIAPEDVPRHFTNGENVGGILGAASGHRVDVDCDCAEVLALASRFLPTTGSIFGRPSNPASHRIYLSPDAPYIKLADPTRKDDDERSTLIELRQDGHQTVLPGSIHTSGEPIAWVTNKAPASIGAQDLAAAVHRIGAAALLARYYPGTGSRQDLAMHLSGALLRAGWDAAEAEHFIGAVANAAHDEEPEKREATVQRTQEKLDRGEPVTGLPRIAEMLDPRIVAAVAKWLGLRAGIGAEEHQTELGLADRIVREHGDKMRFVYGWDSWIAWDGQRWTPKAEGDIWQMAKATVRPLLSEAVKLPEGDARKAAVKFAMMSERDRTIRSALNLARSEPGIAIKPEMLNQDTYLLNTPSGIVDLRTGTVRSHDQAALLTKLCPTPYGPAATAPEWERFLLRVFDRDFGIITFVQRLMGYAATGSCREHLLPIFWGKGANGKSTLTTAVMDVLGQDYAGPIAHSLLFAETKDSHPTAVADLYGKRIAVTHELDSGTRLAEGLVKNLTGGDRLKARRMREDLWQFTPTHTLFLATNTKPIVRGTDDGIWRRLKLIPFTVQIPEAERDTRLGDKLRAEAPGILAWIVAGARDWYQHGLDTPASVQAATTAYRSASDVIGEYLAARCIVDPTSKTTAKALYENFVTWHKDQIGGDPITQTTFGRRLGDRGFVRLSDERPIAWSGIGIASEPIL